VPLYATKEEALAAKAQEQHRSADVTAEVEQRRLRHRLAGQIANGLIAAIGEDHPDVDKLAMRTVKITDRIMDYLKQTEDGDYPDWW
jgi:hypothetical protein